MPSRSDFSRARDHGGDGLAAVHQQLEQLEQEKEELFNLLADEQR
eukprot:SAG31_NODE_16276_length_715_cov_2.225649_2_plen_45_part_00